VRQDLFGVGHARFSGLDMPASLTCPAGDPAKWKSAISHGVQMSTAPDDLDEVDTPDDWQNRIDTYIGGLPVVDE
jgi:hypothetical protein